MTITRIAKTEKLSRVVIHEKVAYFSGLTADDRSQDTVGQTEQVLAKADAFLEKIGSNRSLLLSATIWLRDIEDFDAMNKAWTAWIDKDEPPARATVQAILGLPDIKVEIQFTVALP
ncbi:MULTISPECIES: RidA family protein [unclassified Rhizobium]|uniref:RidA family protein n=1 Tax=unclassified Rhizobium TaxID=2613769 RepID=UPI001ADA461E|nr:MULTISPECIES: RidA family protein [unclassified Rhizobium]MBO9101322.1 RidA family protein [Rhizobium sp. L58/93]MBO9182777.1 RidA family protein [Rhizobium sp. E27B/91]QXZ86386.1 RidA family protein [Rhizobium sp. K1/93]QXZ92159.1 RidA family protein [Rhizobium sp. K15/93]